MPNKLTGFAILMFLVVMIRIEVSGLTIARLIALIAFAVCAIGAAPLDLKGGRR